MSILVWDSRVVAGSSITGQVCTDGTYVYFENRTSGMVHTLYKYDIATMTQQLAVPVVDANGGQNWNGTCLTDGTHVILTTSEGIRAYRCSDLGDLGVVWAFANWLGPNGFFAAHGFYDGTYFWVPGYGSPNGRQINRVTPGTWAVTSIGNTSLHGTSINYLDGCGADLIIQSYNLTTVKRINKNGTVVWTSGNFPGSVNAVSYDPIRDEVWCADNTCECVVLRGSDGAFIDRTGAVVADYASAVIVTGNGDSYASSSVGIGVIGDMVYVGPGNNAGIQRRSIYPPRMNAGYFPNQGPYPAIARVPWNFIAAGAKVVGSMGANGFWSLGGIEFADYTLAAPNLVSVNPNGDGIDVTADSPINVGTPTLGAPTTKLAVTGASQITGNSIHVVVDPIAPKITTAKANANGVDLIFDKAVDVGATPDYGTTVNNLRVVTAAPLSTTEVQLAATVTSGTYEWLSTPIVVTGVGVLPHVVAAWAESNTTFVLIFNEAVIESSAVNIANYAITPALDIISIEKMDSTTYRMHTSQQTGNTTYYVTLTGVIDPANNPI